MAKKYKASNYNKARWQQQCIDRAHQARASDPVKQAKIDAQAYVLIRERIEMFGDQWHDFSAIRLPADVQAWMKESGPKRVIEMLAPPQSHLDPSPGRG
jgi:hypothetical protein